MMPPWLFDVNMDGVVQEVNVRVLGRILKLVGEHVERFQITQNCFAMTQHSWLTHRISCVDW